MKVAILYICTGKYNQFFDGFYKSAMKYLLPKYEKTFFVWTDDDNIADGLPNVKIIHKECAGFPLDSLFRFEMFLSVEKELAEYEYVYFIQANAMFLQYVGDDILPDESGLAMGIWGGKMLKRPACIYPYERNKKSLAYVEPYGKNYIYFMGGINGGRSKEFLEMIRTLSANIRKDYENGIIAKVHDQSHINAYLRHNQCKIIPPQYCWPEESVADFEPKMIFRDKVRIDPYFDKGRKHSLWAKFIKGCTMTIDIFRWYLKI